jgi:hypothetical protein
LSRNRFYENKNISETLQRLYSSPLIFDRLYCISYEKSSWSYVS